MQQKLITSIEDITKRIELVNLCLDRAAAIDGLRYNTDVAINQGQVIAAFSGEEIVGGYVLIHKAPFRILTLADTFRGDQHYSASLDQTSLVEVGALWLHPEVGSKIQSGKFWFSVLRNVAKLNPSHMIYGINMDRQGLVNLYHRMKPEILWQGDTTQSGIKTHARLTCEKVKIFNFYVQVSLLIASRFLSPNRRGITRLRTKPTSLVKG